MTTLLILGWTVGAYIMGLLIIAIICGSKLRRSMMRMFSDPGMRSLMPQGTGDKLLAAIPGGGRWWVFVLMAMFMYRYWPIQLPGMMWDWMTNLWSPPAQSPEELAKAMLPTIMAEGELAQAEGREFDTERVVEQLKGKMPI